MIGGDDYCDEEEQEGIISRHSAKPGRNGGGRSIQDSQPTQSSQVECG
jgi:hypothetical protein